MVVIIFCPIAYLDKLKSKVKCVYSKSKAKRIKCAKTNIKLEKKSKMNYYTFTHNVLVLYNVYEKFEPTRNQNAYTVNQSKRKKSNAQNEH